MPVLDIETYKIDFLILESNDPKVIVLLDRSVYLDNPEKPLLEVTLPGFTGYIEVPYNINGITVLDSDVLKITESCDYDYLADLPDGVWHIRQKVCPVDELFESKCYLKTQRLQEEFNALLLTISESCYDGVDKTEVNNDIIDIEILIKVAKLEAGRCNAQTAIAKYNAANRKITRLFNKINNC